MSLKIPSITVSVSSKRAVEPYGAADNLVSFQLQREDGLPFSPEEALLAKVEMTLALKRTVLVEELVQGLISSKLYEAQREHMEKGYEKLLQKVRQDPGSFLDFYERGGE